MTKKQLEKYQKEFDEFVANVEKMGGRFLTEDELRYKINGGVDSSGDSENSQEESGSPSVEGESSEDIDSAPTEATADGAGESEEAAEEDDGKSFLESVCEAVGGVVDAVGDAVSGAAHAVGEVIEDVIDFFTGGSEDKTEQNAPSSDGTVETESQNKTSNGTDKDNPENKNSKNGEKTVENENSKELAATPIPMPTLTNDRTASKNEKIDLNIPEYKNENDSKINVTLLGGDYSNLLQNSPEAVRCDFPVAGLSCKNDNIEVGITVGASCVILPYSNESPSIDFSNYPMVDIYTDSKTVNANCEASVSVKIFY
ncbi:MAG: hypothetical protein IJ530_14945 [Treponema sp.]|uniref:hypothetical protein n=1 Tax=Treponema sp. TaxID=166 RepID=UPI0025E57DE4|nr:hypothetical protein [Treponema sp.]MBQ8681026.1 hypothetical protein [Treponema sp.]